MPLIAGSGHRANIGAEYRVYAGPMPNALGLARTYHFATEEEARTFAAHTKMAAWSDHKVDRKVTITFPGGFTVAITLEPLPLLDNIHRGEEELLERGMDGLPTLDDLVPPEPES